MFAVAGPAAKKDFGRLDRFDFEPATSKKSNLAELQRREAKVKALHHELDQR